MSKASETGGKTPAQQREDHIEALKRERDGYMRAGDDKKDRVAQVDKEIKRLQDEAKPARQSQQTTREG